MVIIRRLRGFLYKTLFLLKLALIHHAFITFSFGERQTMARFAGGFA